MKALSNLLALVLVAPVFAQDSVSQLGSSLPGDAVSPYDTGEQLNAYVVDLTPFKSSGGTIFGIAPIVKASRGVGVTSTFANNGISAQAISATMVNNQAFPVSSYSFWNTPGAGVNNNAAINSAPGSVMVSGSNSTQFALAFDEFGETDSALFNDNIVTAVVNFLPDEPNRLYVARIAAAQNGANGTEARSVPSMGSVDDQGNVHFRADGFGAVGPNQLFNNNWFRVSSLSRSFGSQNIIDASGGSDSSATEHILNEVADTHNPPSIIPCSIAGRPVLLGTNFLSEFVHEEFAVTTTATMAHLGVAGDHRGGVTFSKSVVVPGGAGTCTMLGQGGTGLTRGVIVFGIDFDGTPLSTSFFEPPASVTDNATGHVSDVSGESIHHRSQTAFQGGNGQTALGRDTDGNFLVAYAMESDPDYMGQGTGVTNNPRNAIVVAKISSLGALQGWTTAAYIDATARKPILNHTGRAIGQLAELLDVTGGSGVGNPDGPSMSAPTMDAAGNIWFVGSVELFHRIDLDMNGSLESSDFDNALLRAVYDPATFSYNLELVVELGQVFKGRNSGRRYQISFISIADANSVSSSAMWSSNASQSSWNNVSLTGIAPRDARSLGGIVLNASITYDTDDDGTYDNMLGLGVDERYSALLYIGRIKSRRDGFLGNIGDAGTRTP
jgi:hypothetical protein